jgi:hypothetical protein
VPASPSMKIFGADFGANSDDMAKTLGVIARSHSGRIRAYPSPITGLRQGI